MSVQKTSEKHPVLYHYTTLEGFHGIMDSQKLRAKHFRDLNDRSEVFHILEKLQELLVPSVKAEIKRRRSELKKAIREFGGRDALAKNQTNAALNAFFDVTFGGGGWNATFPPYVTSFCSHVDDKNYVKENGLLSMWRSYSNDGGIALVFDTLKLEACLKKESEEYLYSFAGVGDVVYEGDNDAFISEFEEFVEVLKVKVMDMLLGNESFTTGADFIKDFIGAATRYKHQAFAEEREVRITVSPWIDSHFKDATESEIKSRVQKVPINIGGSTYIELFDVESVPRLPITKVIIGPHIDQEQRHKDIREKLKYRRDIEIVCSQTPFIG